MSVALRLRVVLAMAGLCMVATPRLLTAHPLHTTLTEFRYDADKRAVYAMIRVFVDDFGTAVSRYTGAKVSTDHTVPSAAAFKYVASAFHVADRDGKHIPLQWCGERRAGEVLFVCLRGSAPKGVRGMAVRNSLMFDLFNDQVNIVQTVLDGRKRSLLFTRGARFKRIL